MDNAEFSAMVKARTKRFALGMIALAHELRWPSPSEPLGRQLIRCGTSVGANYRAACKAKSPADFLNKIKMVEEEADECTYWLELVIESGSSRAPEVPKLLSEANELAALFASICATLHRRAAAGAPRPSTRPS